MATGQLASTLIRRLPPRLRGVPVFLYHGLTAGTPVEGPSREEKYWVSANHFRDQLKLIRQAGCRVALLRALWSVGEATDAPRPGAVLTFDDGRASNYEVAFPLLQEAGVSGEFFVNTSRIGEPGFLSWQQMDEMHRAGMSFQSHSHEHVDLSRLRPSELARQLGASKQLLEDRLGRSVEFLAVPYGLLNEQLVKVAQQLGYRGVCNSWSWPVRPGARLVSRVPVYRRTTPDQFRGFLAGDAVCYVARAARTALFYLPKQVLLRYCPSLLGVQVSESPA